MSMYDLCNKAIQYCWPNAPVYRDLPFKLQRQLAETYWKDELTDTGRDDYVDDVWALLGTGYKSLIIENAFADKIDVLEFQTTLRLQAEEVLKDDIDGYLSDHFRDYCDSNGIHAVDDYCVEAR